ncbi:MAG: glycoside hydrolase family 38 C-terminal domain-containing protein [Phycisphaerae bacterium]|nr:glycoside hydrolase family 38 C-terminal domain-containing protein [Phycisphaerae bacterium]
MKNKNLEMHLISNTHWDIEYLWSAGETRMMLTEMMDELLKIFEEDPDYKHFHFDGQVFPIDEYLQIRPEKKEELSRYIKDGKILIGPWYSLPDEFLASGESLVRNLLIGHKKARQYGDVMKVGYNIFSFGQISQLPQIYQGFGIDTIIFKRGISELVSEKFEFWWKSPDGTTALAHRIGPGGRSNFSEYVYLPVIAETWGEGRGWEDVIGTLFNLCDAYSSDNVHHLTNPELPYHQEKIPDAIEKLKNMVTAGSTTPYLLILDGHDQSRAYCQLTRLVKDINKVLSGDKLIHSSLPVYVDKLKKAVKNLKVLSGEMRHTGQNQQGPLLPGVLSGRMPLKQINAQVEINLEKWAEPTSVFGWILGKEYPQVFLEDAWKGVLINQQHDGITGTHIDRIYQSIMERYRQSFDIAETLTRKNLEYIAGSIDKTGINDDDVVLVVFNPLTYTRTEVVKATVDFFWDKDVNSLAIQDFNGQDVIVQKVFSNDVRLVIERPFFLPLRPEGMKEIQVYFEAKDIPPLGYKTFLVKPMKAEKRNSGSLITAANVMENEFLKVKINNDGTLTVTDKSNNNTFENLNYFVDDGDVGHPLFHKAPEFNQEIISLGNPCSISLVEDNRLLAVFKIEVKMSLPGWVEVKKILYGEKPGSETTPFGRSNNQKEMVITSYVSLKENAKRVEIITKLNNNIEDHRLRVLFPSRINTNSSFAEGQFDVLERSIEPPDSSLWPEAAPVAHPQHFFVDVNDGQKGLAIINQGLPEYEVINNKDRAIALTLLRCTRIAGNSKNSVNLEQPLAQCPGEHTFRYAIYPHAGCWEKSRIFEQAYTHNVPMKIAQVRKTKGKLPKEMSFFKIEPASLILSAIKRSENSNSLIIRLWNPTLDNIKAKISCCNQIKSAGIVDLEEKIIDKLDLAKDNSIIFDVDKKKILSIQLMLK